MTQKATPISDVTVSGWTPVPVYAQINEATADDSTYVSSSATPQGDMFEVKLAELAWPESGAETLTVRLQQVGGGSDSVTIALIQGNGTIIATRVVQPSSSFANAFDPPLSEAEIGTITDYTDLRVRVIAGQIQSPCCPNNGIPPLLFGTFSNGTGSCSCLNGVTIEFLWDPNYQVWISGNKPACDPVVGGIRLVCKQTYWELQRAALSGQSSQAKCNPVALTFSPVYLDTNCGLETVDLIVTQ